MYRIDYRTEVAGIEVEVQNQEALEALFAALNGRVIEMSDKGILMEFPTAQAARDFTAAAKANGAIIEAVS